jgi:hypothetical protein
VSVTELVALARTQGMRVCELDGVATVFDPGTGRYFVVSEVSGSETELVNHELTEFAHLVLKDPELDSSLLGPVMRVDVPHANQRLILERMQVRTFVSSFFQEASELALNQEMTSFDISLAGKVVRIEVPRFDADFRISLQEAFFGTVAEPGVKPDFTISIIDSTNGPRSFELGFDWDWHLPLGVVDSVRTDPYRIAIDRHTQSISVFSPKEGKCVVWMPSYRDIPYWSAATPLRLQLSWIADSLGSEFIHAAAVKVGEKALLFAGLSGSGKSTLALRLAQLGFPLLGDDFLLAEGEKVTAVYRRLKVHDWAAARVLPNSWTVLNPHGVNEKRIVDPGNELYTEELPIGAIVIPTVGEQFSIEPMTGGQALAALAPPTISGLLGGNESSLERLAAIAAGAPCYSLVVEESLLNDPVLLHKLANLGM